MRSWREWALAAGRRVRDQLDAASPLQAGVGVAVLVVAARLVVAYTWFWGAKTKHPWLDPPFGWLGGWLEVEAQYNPIPGYPWLVENVLLPNLTFLGWTAFVVESYLAVVLVLGILTRLNGWVATLWGLQISLGNLGAPREPIWSLLPMVVLPLLAAEGRAGRIWGIDAWLREKAAGRWWSWML